MSSRSVSSSMDKLSITNVSKLLDTLESTHFRQLGDVLGLGYSKVSRMTNLPTDLAAAWLRAEDNVLTVSGNPSWSSLKKALTEIGQNGIAAKINNPLTLATMEPTREPTGTDNLKYKMDLKLRMSLILLARNVMLQLDKIIENGTIKDSIQDIIWCISELFKDNDIASCTQIMQVVQTLQQNNSIHDWFGFYHLEFIAKNYMPDNTEVNSQLEEHRDIMSARSAVLTIAQFIDEQKRLNIPIVKKKHNRHGARYLKQLKANLGYTTDKALDIIGQLWKDLRGFGLPDKDAVFDGIYRKCIIVVWLIRASKSSEVQEYAESADAIAIFEQYNVQWVMIEDECIYIARSGDIPIQLSGDESESTVETDIKREEQPALEESEEPPQQSISDIVSQPIMQLSLWLQSKFLDLVSASRYNSLEAVKLFLEAKDADPDMKESDQNRWTPAMWAAKNGNLEIMRLLIEHGANVNMESKVNCWTPLIIASQEGHLEIVELLLDHKANIDALTNEGLTAEMVAANRGHDHTVKILVKERMKRSLGSSVDPEPLGSSVDPEPPKAGDETSRPEV